MNIKIESILKDFDSLSLEEQETVLEIEKKRLIEKRREFLIEDVKEAEAEYKSGKLRPKSVDDIMKDLEDETESKIKTKESIIDLAVGLVLRKKIGDKVEKGELGRKSGKGYYPYTQSPKG